MQINSDLMQINTAMTRNGSREHALSLAESLVQGLSARRSYVSASVIS